MDTSFSLAIVNRGLIDGLGREPGITVTEGTPGPATTHAIRNMYPPRLDRGQAGVPTFFYFAWEDSTNPTGMGTRVQPALRRTAGAVCARA